MFLPVTGCGKGNTVLNKTILMGRLTADPELKHTQSGTAVTSFTVAVERNYSRQGEEKQTDFIDCEAWRNTAEFICKYFRKGQMMALSGSIQTGSYTDRDGNKRKTVRVRADEVSFCGGKNESRPAEPKPAAAPMPDPYYSSGSDSDFMDISDSDLPF